MVCCDDKVHENILTFYVLYQSLFIWPDRKWRCLKNASDVLVGAIQTFLSTKEKIKVINSIIYSKQCCTAMEKVQLPLSPHEGAKSLKRLALPRVSTSAHLQHCYSDDRVMNSTFMRSSLFFSIVVDHHCETRWQTHMCSEIDPALSEDWCLHNAQTLTCQLMSDHVPTPIFCNGMCVYLLSLAWK